jgi:hypothetical protein
MIAYVNGYVCTTSCEAAAARAGRDPFAPPGTPPGQSGKSDKADKSSGLDSQPATVFGGSLANLNPTNTVTPTGDTSAPSQPSVNILA